MVNIFFYFPLSLHVSYAPLLFLCPLILPLFLHFHLTLSLFFCPLIFFSATSLFLLAAHTFPCAWLFLYHLSFHLPLHFSTSTKLSFFSSSPSFSPCLRLRIYNQWNESGSLLVNHTKKIQNKVVSCLCVCTYKTISLLCTFYPMTVNIYHWPSFWQKLAKHTRIQDLTTSKVFHPIYWMRTAN